MDENLLIFWAKKSDDSAYHYPLLYHMLDTAVVCEEIWEKCLHASARQFLSRQLDLHEANTAHCLSFWAGLHDIGKAFPDFQSRSADSKHTLESLGFHFNDVGGKDAPHGIATACVLPGLFQGKLSPALARKLSIVVGGHHGVFPDSEGMQRW